MNICKILSTVALVLAMSGPAWATDLFSPALPALESSNWIQCFVVNVSSETRNARIRFFNSLGDQVDDSGDMVLGGGEGIGYSIPASGAALYCKFTVQGRANQFRASISIFQPGVGLISALPAE